MEILYKVATFDISSMQVRFIDTVGVPKSTLVRKWVKVSNDVENLLLFY